ncbi:hypothetical protein HNQ02_003792 [Flavobacterium sp. 7E]|uniref:hypothetical protein n=1 Tax=unclassified Flavobacterium TaxID=196869 RepID=UPI00156F4807|nr:MULTISPECIES: hypothetical protein [unclassified Flavobacterium]NRS90845.1 hypothetical protein [Flavobacterium sp. 7E]NRT14658.1 hypothetical protein [Flavobacterium sp. 28A]
MKIIYSLFNLKKYVDRDFNLFLNNNEFKKFINNVEDITIKYSSLEFFKPNNLKEEQIGYRFNHLGKSLLGTNKGDWKKNWVAIGYDGIGDPIFVDFEKPNLPVFTSEHDEDEWNEKYIAISLDNFKKILDDLRILKQKAENGISKFEVNTFLEKTKNENKYMDVEYWKMFLDSE